MTYFMAILCVLGISVGQLLFKISAKGFQETGSYFDGRSLSFLLGALVLYGITTLGWVWVLQRMNLGQAYPLMALAFVLVPIGSHFLFGERYTASYIVGVAVIAFGVFLTARS